MLSSRVVPVKRAWLHSSWGSRGRWGHLCQLPLQIYFWQGPTSSPCGSYGSLCGCIPSAGHIFSGTPPFTPSPSWWNGCQRGTFISVHSSRCVNSAEERPPLAPAHNLPFPEKSRKLLCCRGWGPGKSPYQTSSAPFLSLPRHPHSPPKAPSFLLPSPQGACPSILETDLIWIVTKIIITQMQRSHRKG